MDTYPRKRKCLVVGILLLFLCASTTFGVSAPCANRQLPRVVQQNIQAIHKDGIGQTCLDGNALISNNTGNDYHPRMTTNGLGHTIVVYEQENDVDSKQIPIVYSTNGGQTWTMRFLFDSINFTAGSGVLQYPDIVYNAPNDLLWLTMIDPDTDLYNMVVSFIPGDIANAENAKLYILGASTGYVYSACACTNNFFLFLTTEEASIIQTLGLFWCTYPDFNYPPGLGGFYYDGNSVFQSAPAAELEMDSNSNQLFSVFETRLDSGTHISIKTNVKDEALITSGEQKDNMDKYGDPEQMPSMYLGVGTDPDVSGSGNKVCVVYVDDGNVICKSSTTSAVYDPGFNWQVSTIDSNASAPAVYMQGNNVSCAYVKSGNLYLKISEDGGTTWSAAEQKNDVDGTVVAEKGAVDIGKTGIVFTDTRNGNYDIYFTPLVEGPIDNNEPIKPNIPSGQANGKIGQEYSYASSTTDPDGDQVYYFWDWGDGSNSGWLGLYNSGVTCEAKHTWAEKNTYNIKVKAKDAYGKESAWSDPLSITMPYSYNPMLQFLERLFERSPHAFPLLRQLMGY